MRLFLRTAVHYIILIIAGLLTIASMLHVIAFYTEHVAWLPEMAATRRVLMLEASLQCLQNIAIAIGLVSLHRVATSADNDCS